MNKTFFAVFLTFLFALPSAFAVDAKEFNQFFGRYEGTRNPWNADIPQYTCLIDISLNKWNQVVVTLTDENGTPLHFRKRGQDDFETTFLTHMTHPKTFFSTFLREAHGSTNDFSHSVENQNWSTTERWNLRFLNMDRSGGGIQITYSKHKRWMPFDSTIAYTSDLNGCYSLRRVQ